MVLETNAFHVGDKHFNGGGECVEKTRSNFSHTYAASYQQLPNRTYVGMIATHRYSPPKTGGITLSYSPLSMLYPQGIYVYMQ